MKIIVLITLVCLMMLPAYAQPTAADQKALCRQLADLSKDTLLSDTLRNVRIKSLIQAYTNLMLKAKPTVVAAPPRVDSVKVTDTVVVWSAANKVIVYTDSAQMALLREDLEKHAMQRSGSLLYVLLFLLLAMVAAVLWRQKIPQPQPMLRPATNELPLPASLPERVDATADRNLFFIAELMMTAGPRKKFMSESHADKDLGEDVCGLVLTGERMGCWLLDGTSDQHCLRLPGSGEDYFSSRLLAQHIGEGLRKTFERKDTLALPLEILIELVIDQVRADWIRTIRALPETEQHLLAANIAAHNIPECASTLLAVRLGLDGDCEAYRSGDSKMIFYHRPTGSGALIPHERSFTTKNPDSNDRIFFRLVLDEKGTLDIVSNTPAHETVRLEAISDLIAFSDGIGPITQQTLEAYYPADAEAAIHTIRNQPQETADDKSICLVQIRPIS